MMRAECLLLRFRARTGERFAANRRIVPDELSETLRRHSSFSSLLAQARSQRRIGHSAQNRPPPLPGRRRSPAKASVIIVTKTITSRQNPWFKRIREAVRDHAEEIVIEGPKPVADAIASGWTPIATVTRGEEAAQSLPWMIEPVIFHPDLFDALTETRSPQSILGLFERPEATFEQLLARRDTVLLALDGVQDPGNVGTIVRLAAAFDAGGVALLPGCADAFGPKAIRASAGAILHVPIVSVTYQELLQCGLPLHAADTAGELTEPPSHDAILVFGNEGSGVSDALIRAATLIAIPTSARVESLNVAASAAILLARSFALRGQR